jgi:hypothetical protein
MPTVEIDNSLYVLGGSKTVQKLSLDSLTWELMQLKLPQVVSCIPFFKAATQVYLVLNKTLYSFTPLQVKAVRTLSEGISSIMSCYSRGTLYYVWSGEIRSLDIGDLTCL